ncbi:MAG: flagellar basal body protein [Succinivibrio sp.]|nr:flagellar basal body protein [Succinivibrio sp.]
MSTSIPVSALNTTQTYLNTTSHNLANLSTEGFKPFSAVSAETTSANGTGAGVEVSAVRQSQESGVNLNTELTDLKREDKVYQANAKVLQVQQNTLGSLLDVNA